MRIPLDDGWVDLERREVLRGSDRHRLTPTEHRLLRWMAARPGLLVDTDTLLVEVWGYSERVRSRTAYVTIQRLRRKIEVDPKSPRHLQSVFGAGYRLVPAGTDAPSGGRAEVWPAQGALPETSGAFVGRESLLRALAVADDPVVTLRGTGGVGKTRVAIEAARIGTAPPCVFVALAEARDETEVVREVALALGLQAAAGAEEDGGARVGRALAHRGPIRVLLDNAEQLGGSLAKVLERWRAAAPQARWWITSRHPVGVEGERVIEVEPLDEHAAVALFVDRGRRARPSAHLDSGAPGLAALVSGQLDGVPLAIELAAARVATMSVEQIAERMSARFRLLRDPLRSPDDRAAAMEATIRWSWELLEPDLQRALAYTTVFRGGFDLDAAEAVLSAGEETWVADQLQLLCDRALLHVQVVAGLPPRFRVLESVRDFASRQLAGQEELARALERHSAWYAEWGDALRLQTTAADGHLALARLLAARDNLRAAYRRSLQGTPHRAATLACVLDAVLDLTGPHSERHDLLTEALDALPEDASAAATRVELLRRRGNVRRLLARWEGARADCEEALEGARALGEAPLEGRAATTLAGILIETEQAARAAALTHLAVERHRAAADPYFEAISLLNLTVMQRRDADLDTCLRTLTEAKRAADLAGAPMLQVLWSLSASTALELLGRGEEAGQHLREAIERADGLGMAVWSTVARQNAGLHALRRGDFAEARGFLEEARQCAEAQGNPRVEAQASVALAELELDAGEPTAAAAHLVGLSRHLLPPAGVLRVEILDAVVARMAGRASDARRMLTACWERAWALELPFEAARTGVYLAPVLADLGELEAASAILARAAPVLEARGDDTSAATLALARAHVDLCNGKLDRVDAERLVRSGAEGPSAHRRVAHLLGARLG